MADTDRVHMLADFADGVDGDAFVDQFYQDCENWGVRGVIIRAEGNIACQIEGAPGDVEAARDEFMNHSDLNTPHEAALEQNVQPRLTALVAHTDRDLFRP